MKINTLILSMILYLNVSAQTTADFEGFGLNQGQFLNGSDADGGFSDGNIFLPNNYNTNYDSWSGWAISAVTDTMTPGFTNQYSSASGAGADGSLAYAVAYIPGEPVTVRLEDEAEGGTVTGLYVNNTTYARLSMLNGDAFAKKFGGESGNDPDFFLLTIEKFLNGEKGQEKIEFYLADYRFDDNTLDHIITEWTWVDLLPLGNADSLVFSLTSSDNGIFGMNTPAFFCVDNLTTTDGTTSSLDIKPFRGRIYPNPASDLLILENSFRKPGTFRIIAVSGSVVLAGAITDQSQQIDISELTGGVYTLLVESAGQSYFEQFAVFH